MPRQGEDRGGRARVRRDLHTMRWLAAWMGVGAAYQLFGWWNARRKYGKAYVDVMNRRLLGGNPVLMILQVLFACIFWPVSITLLLVQPTALKRVAKRIVRETNHEMQGRCADCGSPLDGHEHEAIDPPDVFGGGAA
jgi:hypothetical protein